ncbi:hypothetical protein [Paraburkholderia azotifigens]|uniref:Uncharacterized protein n=1 Tax=Paraburkholderia azotifigens TaxID=2057004 RepID=A0A5C6VBR7_9BURK|nr:hypothetical protein [Paraburkholderia azotifigens]TXC81025.1 hypothetical protein FRZ40_43295 [Paraburkholderia azotifigens]
MNRAIITALFQTFFVKHLAPLGFVMRTPDVAERTFPSFRQGITWTFDDSGEFSSFGCHGFWSFAHEFDDAAPNAGLGDYGARIGGASIPMVIRAGDVTEDTVTECLDALLRDDLTVLNRLTSMEKFVSEIETYPRSRHELIGSGIFALFNHAFCLDVTGQKTKAVEHYQACASALDGVTFPLAMRCKEASLNRAAAIAVAMSESNFNEAQAAVTETSAKKPNLASQSIEAEVARKILPLGIRPASAMPHHFRRAIQQNFQTSTGSFWRGINSQTFLEELYNFQPEYMCELESHWRVPDSNSNPFADLLAHDIGTRQFDEYCATYLLSLPENQVPDDDDDLYELLEEHLEANDESDYLDFLELDGYKVVGYIREVMHEIAGYKAASST